ncbi:FtsW/RodA/SpoVE family cell cycle protein [Enterococcus durans]|uniref:Probable peptidoglycan glycosyltransferase FtsW n=2 Tax=Enterococcus durans TaxID=53345 RepID=A0AB36S790_9ENTE|nr:FtsW/RodA/SpoVE family cell cycle protein [Enterococcus durans]EOT34959.1 cell division protein FtsW [Enterococcus durans ATCC 6056]EOU19451.1 cell division protein FtsW [Enterococcus durans ATCC 6056]PEH44523.1 FtsW/RodA/SpoVE family cell cycle protein [Enterococcus durans]QPQ28294.1 FtsW/RodA/SpoVE family cell cycle protein [Enterococcus durans]QXB37565.1 FtsW/RodA/SpoVE family cell cycle protein [Enterococcus durans]
MPKKVKKRHLLDYSILIPYLILCVLGLIMVYSSSSYLLMENGTSPSASFFNQSNFWVLSLIVIGLLYKMKTDVLKNQRLIMAAIAVLTILLLIVLFFGKEINGAKGWIQIAGFTIQPAEYLKIIAIWYLSWTLSKRQYSIQKDFIGTVKRPLALVLVLTAIVAILPDFGNATVIFLITLVLLLASGINYVYTLIVGFGGVGLSVFTIWLVNITHGKFLPERLQYIYNRFAIFQNPFSDELNRGHQMVNGYYAMFNGGLFGRGLGNSIQKKGFLQEAQTDFIYAIVVEELGVIMGILILALLFFMITRIILVGTRSKDPFNSLLCIGIGAMFLVQVFVNLGGITGVIPLTGITFPFLSQGGSSLLMLSICIGFVLNISADEKRKSLGLY